MATKVIKADIHDGATVRHQGRDAIIDWTTLYQAAHQDDGTLRGVYRPLWDAAVALCPAAPQTDADLYKYANGLPPYSRPVDPDWEREVVLTLHSNAAAMRGDMHAAANAEASLRDLRRRSQGPDIHYDLDDPDTIDVLGL